MKSMDVGLKTIGIEYLIMIFRVDEFYLSPLFRNKHYRIKANVR